MSNQSTPNRETTSHLAELNDGAGCTEIWEHLSHSRDANESSEERSE